MTEQLTPEVLKEAINPNVLPEGDRLIDVYQLEFEQLEQPATARFANPGEVADITFEVSEPFNVPDLQESYNHDAALDAARTSWWEGLSDTLERMGVEREQARALHITTKHEVGITVDGEPVQQGFEVFEVGEQETDQKTLQTVFDTLQLIDQYSGGLLAVPGNLPPIVLLDRINIQNPHGEGVDAGGVASSRAIALNLESLTKMAQDEGVPHEELVAAILVHEVLGHALERKVAKKTGTYFKEHFDYSNERTPGELFDTLHTSIVPKDASKEGSKPVREYGRVNALEDFATSVEASVAKAMGWSDTINQIPRAKATEDSYRRDLVMQLMDRAARQAAEHNGTPGVVGSEISYTTNEQGETVVAPKRQIEVTTIGGEEAVVQEIQKQVQKYKPPKELLVVRPEDVVW